MSYSATAWIAPDNTNFTTFALWAQFISNGLASAGWVQQNDTGQVVWTATVLTFTRVDSAGGNSVYTYSGFTGPAPRVGMSVVVTGFATGGNNGTFTLTAVSGGSSGTVTVTTTTQGNEIHAGSGTTTVNTLPGIGALVYEIWAPSDSLQTGSTAYYLRMEYGTGTSANIPKWRMQLGTGTDGAGTLTGATTTVQSVANQTQSTNPFDCYFSGDSGRFGFTLFLRGGAVAAQRNFFGVERILTSTGTASSDGVFSFVASNNNVAFQGLVAVTGGYVATAVYTRMPYIYTAQGTGTSDVFNGGSPLAPVFPIYGKVGNPFTIMCVQNGGDFADGCFFTTTLYGSSRVYQAINLNGIIGSGIAMAMRYD